MGTRSTINIKREDGTYESKYCHFDGYLEHNGYILQYFYNNEDIINKLISHKCYISALGKTIDTTRYGNDEEKNEICNSLGNIRTEAFDYVWGNGEWNLLNEAGTKLTPLKELINVEDAMSELGIFEIEE